MRGKKKRTVKSALCCTIAGLIAVSSVAVGSALDGADENELEIQTQPVSETEAGTDAESEAQTEEETETESETETEPASELILGDVTFDKKVNLLDSIAIQKYSLSQMDFSDTQIICGDVDRNLKVNLMDSIMVQKFSLDQLDDSSEIGKPINPIQPTEPTEPPTQPTEPPTQPTDPPTQPTEPPTQPTEPTEPDTVELNKTSLTIGVGEKYTLEKSSPTGSDLSDAVYKSNNPDAVKVDASTGEVTGLKVGAATITVTTHNGATASCTVAVKKAPTTMSLNKTSITLGVGETYDLNSSLGKGEGAYSIIYSSDNSTAASVKAAGGLVTAEKPGTAVITATAYNGVKAACTVTVKAAPTAVYLNKTCVAVPVGGTFDLNSSFKNGEGAYYVTYSVKDSGIATVKAAGGLVTGVKPGVTTVTATAYNGVKVECTIAVATKMNVSSVAASVIVSEPKWASKTLKSFSSGAKLNQISKRGNWYMVEYSGVVGYVYNRTFNNQSNYLTISESTLPVVADDLIFIYGKSLEKLYNYVSNNIIYSSMNCGTSVESMSVYALKYRRGSCYYKSSLYYYLITRAGFEAQRVTDGNIYGRGYSPHNWVIAKTEYGWRHIDPTGVNEMGIRSYLGKTNSRYRGLDSDMEKYLTWGKKVGTDKHYPYQACK